MSRRLRVALTALLCTLLALCAMPALAEVRLGHYRPQTLPSGETRYEFDEVAVRTPASWQGKVMVIEYGDRAVFCHEDTRRLWRMKKGMEAGGVLFELCLSGAENYSDLPSCQAIGQSERGYYYLRFPTDDQAYTEDADAAREYMTMWQDIDVVRKSASLKVFRDPPATPLPTDEPGEAVGDSALSATRRVRFEDGFQLTLPADWPSIELTEAQTAAGLFYRAGESGGGAGIAVGYMDADRAGTVEDLMRGFESAGYAQIRRQDADGIETIRFERPEEDYCGVAFYHPVYPEYILFVYVSPLDVDDGVSGAVLDSLSSYSVEG